MRPKNLGSSDSNSIPLWLGGVSLAFGLAGIIVAIMSRRSAPSLGRSGAGLPKKLEERKVGDLTLMVWDDDSMPIEMRVGLIQDLVKDSLKNQQLHGLAQAIVGGGGKVQVGKYMFDVAGAQCGQDARCKANAIGTWVSENVRYTGDVGPVRAGRNGKMESVDLFPAPHRTIEMGGGDCFPVHSKIVTRDGIEEIVNVEVGDVIHDGCNWTKVLKTWWRGPKQIYNFTLNNGCHLRLSGNHKTLRVPRIDRGPGQYECAEEVKAEELRVDDDLLQPRLFSGASDIELSDDEAFMVGAYLAEGCRINHHPGTAHREVSLAGIADSKMIRERAISVLNDRGIKFREYERELRFSADEMPMLYDLGRIAEEKHLPSFRYGPQTVATILKSMQMGDGGLSTSGVNMVYSTISQTLALQYRVLQRMMGRSTSITFLEKHGGFGPHPIYRVTVRSEDERKPWAKIKAIEIEDNEEDCVDIMTESGRVYLPEADVITRQCDDHSPLNNSLLEHAGVHGAHRVTAPKQMSEWQHIFSVADVGDGEPVALDTTLPGGYRTGRMAPHLREADFPSYR